MPRKRPELTPEQKRQKRADQLTKQRRIDDFVRIRLRGAKFWDLREFVREKEKEETSAWFLHEGEEPMSDPQIHRYQRDADEAILASVEEDRPKILKRSLARRDELYACALAQGEIRTALSVEQDLAELMGLYPDPKRPPERPRPPFRPHDDDADDTTLEPREQGQAHAADQP